MKLLKKQLVDLLKIQAPSGKEYKVRNYLKKVLPNLVDKMWVDSYGNLLAEKKVGSGKGATILLSAHMDTVNRLEKGRKIIEKNNGVFCSSKGILGADDRAGIAIILAVLRNVEKTSFEGTLKIAFSREEESGCIGSSKIDPKWYQDANLAIVVDRRGNRDIVVGNWNAFCSDAVGYFFEECSAMLDMDWKATEGGISDACTFSENGVNSVNLSAGYFNEHTNKEEVHLQYMKDTVNLILQALALVNQFAHTFGEVPTYNKWVDGTRKNRYYVYTYESDDEVLFDQETTFGPMTVERFCGHVYITQGKGKDIQEIIIDEETFMKICDNFYLSRTMEIAQG